MGQASIAKTREPGCALMAGADGSASPAASCKRFRCPVRSGEEPDLVLSELLRLPAEASQDLLHLSGPKPSRQHMGSLFGRSFGSPKKEQKERSAA